MKFIINKSDGYILLETAMMSICIAALTGCMYFFKVNAISIYDCKARVIAEFMAQQYIDEIAILGYPPENKNIGSNGIDFYIEEDVLVDDTSKDKLVKVSVSWQYNSINHSICKEYRYNEKQ